MILGRYKMMTMFGGTMDMVNVTPSVKKVFEMAGITKIIPIIEEIGGKEIGKCV
jgi:anti-anti-sigma regulatory factor